SDVRQRPRRLAGWNTGLQVAEFGGGACARALSRAISANSRRCCVQADAGPNLHGPRVGNSMAAEAAVVTEDNRRGLRQLEISSWATESAKILRRFYFGR